MHAGPHRRGAEARWLLVALIKRQRPILAGGVAGGPNHRSIPVGHCAQTLIRDNDRAFGGAFKARVRAMGIRERPASFRSPWQNGYAERLIGSVRRECTDHLIAFNAEHLRRILAKYAISNACFAREGRALHTLDRAVRRGCWASDPWRAPSSVRSNLDFGSDKLGFHSRPQASVSCRATHSAVARQEYRKTGARSLLQRDPRHAYTERFVR
jgi:hypothetical protein